MYKIPGIGILHQNKIVSSSGGSFPWGQNPFPDPEGNLGVSIPSALKCKLWVQLTQTS